MRRYLLGTVSLLLLAGTSAQSAPQVTPTGFLVKLETNIHAPVAKVYEALVAQIGSWWNPEHTYSHDAKNLSIDPRPGGCFCEKLPNGGGVVNFKYDSFGRRTRKASPAGTTNYLYGEANLAAEIDGAANIVASYAAGPAMDELLGMRRTTLASNSRIVSADLSTADSRRSRQR